MSPTATICSSFVGPWIHSTSWTVSQTRSQIYAFFIDIESLDNNKYSLMKPITVFIRMDNDEFIGEIEEIETYSFGATEADVIKELKTDLIDLFEHYTDSPDDKLGKNPLKWKAFLLNHIQKNR